MALIINVCRSSSSTCSKFCAQHQQSTGVSAPSHFAPNEISVFLGSNSSDSAVSLCLATPNLRNTRKSTAVRVKGNDRCTRSATLNAALNAGFNSHGNDFVAGTTYFPSIDPSMAFSVGTGTTIQPCIGLCQKRMEAMTKTTMT